jgi:two-component sensor histidine kinase
MVWAVPSVSPDEATRRPWSLAELARNFTGLRPGALAHLQRMVATWEMLADFCFSDLLLLVPIDPQGSEFLVMGQVRPSTSQTLHRSDLVGQTVTEAERPVIARSFALGEIIEGEVTDDVVRERVRLLCIPVRYEGEVIAVLSRESTPIVGRSPGELERVYVSCFNRFARMIAAGEFPFDQDDSTSGEAPRVGDGVIVLDRSQTVEYASPNAVSALHRVGVHANANGMRLGELGFDDELVRNAFQIGAPVTHEVERGSEVTVLVSCIPVLDRGSVSGAVVLFRDISELRRRDRLLLSKDATIREIHHRVKNNLQTISSLLRLQGRRLDVPEAKAAIEESVRRIQSIALVHDTLSKEAGEDVPFIDIVRPLVRMVEEGLISPERHVGFSVTGDAGSLPAIIATPMAVVVTELLQNAVDHAFPYLNYDGPTQPVPVVAEWAAELAESEEADEGNWVRLELSNDGHELVVRVVDNGVGVPEGFTIAGAKGLGLSIVRALVVSDLGGTIDLFDPPDGASGTVVELRVSTDAVRPA